jgi:fatty-acid desaturase
MNLANMKTSSRGQQEEEIDILRSLPFFGVHLTCLTAFLTGISWNAVILCFVLYVVHMFGITAGYHRYLSHKSYRTCRIFQFFQSWLGCSAVQKGPLWWASHHRRHHQHSDEEEDIRFATTRSSRSCLGVEEATLAVFEPCQGIAPSMAA